VTSQQITGSAAAPVAAEPVHRMKLSIPSSSTFWGRSHRNRWLAVWCTCMAQTNDQTRDPAASVDQHFWGFDYLAVIPITQPAGPVFSQHVADFSRQEAS
jgi:hypothetical protein